MLRIIVLFFLITGHLADSRAQTYPQRPITVVAAQAPGGGTDALTRLWAAFASKQLGQPIVVENKPGAGGNIAASDVLRRPADGYTVYSTGVSSSLLSKFLYKNVPYNAQQDFAGVSMLASFDYILLASLQSGIKTAADLRTASDKAKGALHYGSAGIGNINHLIVEMLGEKVGLQLNHIPFKGESAAATALLGGDVQLVAMTLANGLSQVAAGRAVPLAVYSKARLPELPQVPTVAELGLKQSPEFIWSWSTLVVRAGTPDAAIEKLHGVTQAFLADPASQEALRKLRFAPMPSSRGEFERIYARDYPMWASLTKSLGIVPE